MPKDSNESWVKLKSGDYSLEDKVLYIGKKPFGIRTYEHLIEDLENPEYIIEEVNMEEISIGQKAQGLLMDVYDLGISIKMSMVHEQELVRMINSGTKQIDTMGSRYVDWLIERSEGLNNPLMVLEDKDRSLSLVQYLGSRGDTIRLKKVRTYATQPSVCERELSMGRDIYSIITINKSDVLNKQIVWRFVGTGLEQAIAETLTMVISGQLSFQQTN